MCIRDRAGLPQWNRRRTQAQPGLAGSGRTPPVKGVGEPCAGEPHARFDGRGLETERTSVTAPAPDPTNLRVRAHVFICMLAAYLVWHLRQAWAPLTFTDEHRPDPIDPVAPCLLYTSPSPRD